MFQNMYVSVQTKIIVFMNFLIAPWLRIPLDEIGLEFRWTRSAVNFAGSAVIPLDEIGVEFRGWL